MTTQGLTCDMSQPMRESVALVSRLRLTRSPVADELKALRTSVRCRHARRGTVRLKAAGKIL